MFLQCTLYLKIKRKQHLSHIAQYSLCSCNAVVYSTPHFPNYVCRKPKKIHDFDLQPGMKPFLILNVCIWESFKDSRRSLMMFEELLHFITQLSSLRKKNGFKHEGKLQNDPLLFWCVFRVKTWCLWASRGLCPATGLWLQREREGWKPNIDKTADSRPSCSSWRVFLWPFCVTSPGDVCSDDGWYTKHKLWDVRAC